MDPILHYLTYRMNGSVYKIYHQLKSRDVYDIYLSKDVNPTLLDEVVLYPMRQLYKEFSQGHIKGRTLLQFNPGPAPYKLLVCCDFFEEINVLEFNEENSKELRKWLKKDPGALDWTRASQYACTLEGKSNGWIEKEEQLRERIKRVIDCDLTADPLVTPGTLPPVDCILSIGGLESIINDQDNFRKNLGKMAALLKVGGHVAFFGAINGKSYKVGEHLVPCFGYNEGFLKAALRDTGFVIESLERRPGVDISDYIIYDSFVYVRARKVRET
ncbi:indolethylamine N-methyltransferase-like isoform X4 [Hyla sarda]|uniref:indolethylamine N-methyltransferase-like isoform X3 n=1 Tax=Hyla sarda TaxID=327740 RepID=UPI0024C44D04|nr:indolethylamine N-methyltransferase-like isoform X3 [Hyla sarda]XP_056399680.1 indolethylamine N-methyltransferase-like isoform X4 [Hyla sarda]